MKPTLPLRIASGLSLVFAAGHIAGGLKSWSPVGETQVLRDMGRFHFEVGSITRTYLDFYFGFGVFIGVYLLLQAVVLWQLATMAKSDPLRARPVVASFLLAAIASTYISWRYIFIVPVIFSAAIAACLVAAFYACIRNRVV
jgi:hypothetical protein